MKTSGKKLLRDRKKEENFIINETERSKIASFGVIHSILAQYISLTVTRYDSGAIQRGGYCKLSRKR